MSQALPGTHLCLAHQGNHSHYAPHNCEICKLQEQVETATKALRRLSAAALARDATMGDQCALLAAKAELADANKQAMEAIKATTA